MIREAYQNHVREVEEKIKKEPATFWEHIKSKKVNNNTPTILRYQDQTYTDPKEIAETFATHFSSVFCPKNVSTGNVAQLQAIQLSH